MDKEKIGRGIVKGAKWLMVVMWTIVLILLTILIKKNITLSAQNIRKDVAENFKNSDFSVVHLDDSVNITISTKADTKDIIPQVRNLYRKLSKYKLTNNVDTISLIIGDMNDRPIMYSKIELQNLKQVKWDNIKTYEGAIEILNIKIK
jgi:hypothetical protein